MHQRVCALADHLDNAPGRAVDPITDEPLTGLDRKALPLLFLVLLHDQHVCQSLSRQITGRRHAGHHPADPPAVQMGAIHRDDAPWPLAQIQSTEAARAATLWVSSPASQSSAR